MVKTPLHKITKKKIDYLAKNDGPSSDVRSRQSDDSTNGTDPIKKERVKIDLKKIRKSLHNIYKKLPKKWILIGLSITIILIIGYLAAMSLLRQQKIVINSVGDGDIISTNVVETPDYVTLLPGEKTINDLGGWQRVSPAKTNPVFAYADKINGTPISVSQQPIPKDFKPDVDVQVADLAKDYDANQIITAGKLTVYVGTSHKGPQSVIFTKDNLLILIKSQAKLSDKAWGKYAKSLH